MSSCEGHKTTVADSARLFLNDSVNQKIDVKLNEHFLLVAIIKLNYPNLFYFH